MSSNRLKALFNNQLFRTVIATLLGLMVSGLMLLAININPIVAYKNMFIGVFSSPRNIAEIVIKATPIIITGASVAFAFKTGLFNIGVEGQFIAGFLLSGIAGILFNFPWFIQVPFLIIVGIIGGFLFGSISGFLKSKFGVHEVISGIMLNWIAFYLQNYVALSSPLHIDKTMGTRAINISGQIKLYAAEKAAGKYQELSQVPILGEVLARSDINYGIIIAIITAIILHYIIKKSTLGYQLRAVGFNKDGAEFAGININKNIIKSMAISGAVAGLAGAIVVMSGTAEISSIAMFENYGFDGLSVSLIAGSNLIGVILAGFLFAIFKIGGIVLQLTMKTPSEIISVLIGVIIFFIALSNILPAIADKIASRKVKREKMKENK